MSELYKLDRWIWSEKDFEEMGWHDSYIYSIGFYPEDFEFALDLDYIFKWIKPADGETFFKFWIAPVTMVFENVYDLKLDIETSSGIEIDGIDRSNPAIPRNLEFIDKSTEWEWKIECQQGLISLKAAGYKMYVKSEPIFLKDQVIGIKNRGGINFKREKLA